MARVLVIEDEELMRETIAEMLANAGHEVIEATNGVEGLERFHADPVELVITDIIMPKKEGIETIAELHMSFPDLPIIAISGGSRRGQGSYLPTAEALGATVCLDKPFSREALLQAVNMLLS